ncbi:MAG TPA: YafY family protein [Acetobacteraceae bacterium]|jgi:predicted DNA-binding transcriptional regulator YafY|nr:YafY family protein [Acetobacteraceae bacterium]
MRPADRLFDIIQRLRTARGPLTAAALAEELEVTPRTVYRDIATLQARRVPIEGAAGLGYVLRRGYDLPPLMFSADEVEAVLVGMRLLRRTRDPGLQQAAESVLSKLAAVLPEQLRGALDAPPFHVSEGDVHEPSAISLAELRVAIREANKLRIRYRDGDGAASERVIRPVAIEYYVTATLVCAWCELRNDYRHFRADRIEAAEMLPDNFAADRKRLLSGWLALTRPT